MGSPTMGTTKRLFAVCGNRCAFPKCSLQLVDSPSGKVTGRICHIKARQPGGPRYDSSQTEEQRQDFANLLLLCPIHHDVIDDDPEAYTVGRLTKMKADHERSHVAVTEPDDVVARQLIAAIENNVVTQGSIIFTQNQLGGQVAHSIQNFGPQPRQFSQAAASALVADLRHHPAEDIDLVHNMGDAETYQLAAHLKLALEGAGWQINEVIQMAPLKFGVHIETQVVRPSLQILLNWLENTGLKPQGNLNKNAQKVRVIVGARP